MPVFTIETTYYLPVFRQRTFRAPSLVEACGLAVADDDWGMTPDYENAGATAVTGIWRGKDSAYRGEAVPVPANFVLDADRKLALFATLLALLKEPARPPGPSRSEFEDWLPRALAAIAQAEAIEGDCVCALR